MTRKTVGCGLIPLILLLPPRLSASEVPSQPVQSLLELAHTDWDSQHWQPGLEKLRQIVEGYPEDPGVAEAHTHIAWYLSYTASPIEAIREYRKAIAFAPDSRAAAESKMGIAALKHWLGEYRQAYELFREVVRQSEDWSLVKESTYRMKEIGRQLGLQKQPAEVALLDCGPKALQYALASRGVRLSDSEAGLLIPIQQAGATLDQLRRAAESKAVPAWGVQLTLDQLVTAPKPVVVHLRSNHFAVVTHVGNGEIHFSDPHRGPAYNSEKAFQRLWTGYALLLGGQTPSAETRLLNEVEMMSVRGGHHLHGMNLGGPEVNPASEFFDEPSSSCGPGLPRISVNLSNFNLLVQDTLFSYSGRGPSVGLTLTYNADDPTESIFGRSWTFNYNVSLDVHPNDSVDLKRESGKVDNFITRGDGSFIPPRWIYDDLRRSSERTYTLRNKLTRLTQHFDARGRLSRITDPNHNEITFEYDGDRLTSIIDTAGRRTRFTYNSRGKVAAVVDPIGRQARFTYDGSQNLITVNDLAGNRIQYQYNSMSYLTSVDTPQGRWQIQYGTTPHFQEFPFVVKTLSDPLGNATAFDTDCCIAWVFDARGNQTFYFNNPEAETTKIIDPLGNLTQAAYLFGNLTELVDANGRRTVFDYDSRGNIIRITDPLGQQTVIAYDSDDNPIRVTDALGRTTHYFYDGSENLISIVDSSGRTARLDHDFDGQLITVRDFTGNRTTYRYDFQGNLIRQTDGDGATTTFEYDGVGRLSRVTDANGSSFEYAFDENDRPLRIRISDGSEITFRYDCCRLESVSGPGGELTFESDAANRLVRFTNSDGQSIHYAYDENANLTALTYPGGKAVRYEYDTANRLQRVTDWLNNTTDYRYDPVGNLLSSHNSNGTFSVYGYDQANRLVALYNGRAGGTPISSHRYQLDAFGNRVGEITEGPLLPNLASVGSREFSYGEDNRLVSSGEQDFEFDANGNLTAVQGEPGAGYEYDYFNRLVEVRYPDRTSRFTYDAMGNRTSQTVDGVVFRSIVSPLGVPQLLAVTGQEGEITDYYVYGVGLTSKISAGGEVYFYHFDGIGSTLALTDSSGEIVNSYAYSPFGSLFQENIEKVSNPFRYAGRHGVTDEGNHLLYMRARYYSTDLARFLSRDPAGFTTGLNLYSYVENNPILLVDPSGRLSIPVAIGIAAGVGYGGYQIYRGWRRCLEEVRKAEEKLKSLDPFECLVNEEPCGRVSMFPYTAARLDAFRACVAAGARTYLEIFKRIPGLGTLSR